MKQSYYIFSSGELKRRNDSITLIDDDFVKKDIPVERIKDLHVFGNVTYNSKLFDFVSQQGILIHMYNYYGYYSGTFYPKEKYVSGKLLVKQVEAYIDYSKRLQLAKEFIYSASYNILRNLKYYQNRGRELKSYIEDIENLRNQIHQTETIEELMGVEGNIRKIYYDSWKFIIHQEIDFEKRVKRPPDNMVNSLISFLNTVIYTKTLSQIYQTQLNPTISYLHEPSERRFSLALDVSEIFKPLIVDRTIFSLLNKNIITEDDFEQELNFLKLKDSSRKKVLQELESSLSRTIMHRSIKRKVSYEHLIKLELYKLIRFFIEDETYNGFKIWW